MATSFNNEQLAELKRQLTEVIDEMPPVPMEIVAITGEMFSPGALRLARVYDKARNGQRMALDRIAEAFEKDPPSRTQR